MAGSEVRQSTTRQTSGGRTFASEPAAEYPPVAMAAQRPLATPQSGQIYVFNTPLGAISPANGPVAPTRQSITQPGQFYPAYASTVVASANSLGGTSGVGHSRNAAPGQSSTTRQLHPADTNADLVYPVASDTTPNVIVFGESGVGKSSLINMITGTDTAATSNEAIGCTFQSSPYDAVLHDRTYRIWDTIGLNEGERGTASADRAIENLHRLVQNLKNGGVSLLVYCIRGARIRDIIKINYDLFYTIICNGQVPIVLVITGLENEDNMEDWWRDNCGDLANRGLRFHGHACVTSTRGKLTKDGKHTFEAEYNHSVQLVRQLIVNFCPRAPWKPDGSLWLINIVETMNQMFLQNQDDGLGGSVGTMERDYQNLQMVAHQHHRSRGVVDEILAFFRYIVRYATMAGRY